MADEVVKGAVLELSINDSSFSAGMKNLKQQISVIDSSFKASGAGVKDWGNTLDGLKANADALGQKITVQKQIVQAYTDQLEKSRANLDKHITTTTNLKTKLDATTTAYEQSKLAVGAEDAATVKLRTELDALTQKYKASESAVVKNQSSIQGYTIQVNNATGKLNSFEAELTDTNGKIQTFGSEANRAETETKQLGNSLDGAKEKGSLLGKIFAGGLFANIASKALNSLGNMLKNFATAALNTADQLKGLTAETGLSSTELQKLRYIGEDVGVGIETMATSMKRIVKSMESARDGAGTQAEAYKKLGIQITETNGELRDGNTVYGEVLNALGKMTNETERDALAQIVLGRSATELNAIIELGADGMKELGDQAENTGAIMSEGAVTALDNLGDSIDHAKQKAESLVGEGLAKIIEATKTVASLTSAATTLEDTANGTDKVTESTAAASQVAEQYIDRLDELAKSGLDTADAQKEYKTTVDQLNAIIPDLGVTINSETGLIDQNTASLRENVQACKENAIAQALADAYSAAIKEAASSQLELTAATNSANTATANLEIIYQQIVDRMGMTGQAAIDMKAAMSGMTWTDISDAAYNAGANIGDLSGEFTKNINLLGEAEQKELKYGKAVDKSTGIIESYDAATKGAKAALFDTMGVTEDTTDATDDSTTATRKLSNEVDDLSNALQEQSENGELSFATIMDLIDAGYAAALQVNSETGAVTINRDAYIALAQAKIQDQIATLNSAKTSIQGKVSADGAAALTSAGDFVILAGAKSLASEADKTSYASITAQIAALSSLSANLKNLTVTTKSAGGGASSASKAATEATKKAEEAAKKAEAAYDKLFKSLKEKFENGEIDLKTFIDKSEAARDQYLKKNTDAWTESYEDMFDQVKDVETDRLKDIKDNYDDALDDIQDKIDDMQSNLLGVGGITETIKVNDKDITKLSNLDKQTSSITAFGDALNKLKERGVSSSMLSEIASMDVAEGTQTANLLLGLSDADWQVEMTAWEAKQAVAKTIAEAYYADDVKTLNDSLTSAVTNLQTDMTKAGLNLGGNITDGIVAGIKAGTLNVESAMSTMMESALTAAKTTAQISSPSKRGKNEIGMMLPAGVAEGITAGTPAAKQSAAVMMDDIISQAKTLRVQASSAIMSLTSQVSSNSSGSASQKSNSNQIATADIVNAMLAANGASQGTGGTYVFQLVADKKVLAEIVYDPLKDIAKQKGE